MKTLKAWVDPIHSGFLFLIPFVHSADDRTIGNDHRARKALPIPARK